MRPLHTPTRACGPLHNCPYKTQVGSIAASGPKQQSTKQGTKAAMAVTGKRGVGIPTILLHDGEGTIVSIEMRSGETYRGLLDEAEDNMNCVLKDAARTDLNGNVTRVEQIYLRGSQILFIIFPDIYPFHLFMGCISVCLCDSASRDGAP